MSWNYSAYALELQRICVAYELELQLICVEVCQKRDFSRDIGSPTHGSASYYCISKCCRSSGSLSILTASIISFLIFSGLFLAPFLKFDLKIGPGGYQNMSDFFSTFLFSQYIVKLMIKNKSGSIINISSNAAKECDAGRVGYASSKAALIAFTKVLSKELGSFNIRVNAIAPGLTNTKMMGKDVSRKVIEEAIKRVALKRPAEPEEISDVVVFLGSDLSSYISGEVIFVTGGY